MRFLLALLAAPAAAQTVEECPDLPATALVEPWEETTALLAEGAIRLALVEELDGVALAVLTLAPEEGAPRRCRLVAEGGIGFASLDVAAVAAEEDAEAATLTATVPGLRFVPESSELEEVALRLTFGVADDSLAAAVEGTSEGEEPPEEPEAP